MCRFFVLSIRESPTGDASSALKWSQMRLSVGSIEAKFDDENYCQNGKLIITASLRGSTKRSRQSWYDLFSSFGIAGFLTFLQL